MTAATGLVTVATYEEASQGEASRDLLEEMGIHAILAEDGLQVPAPDAARAVEILRAHEADQREASVDEALVEDEEDTSCISCGAKIPEYLEKCPACGWSYT